MKTNNSTSKTSTNGKPRNKPGETTKTIPGFTNDPLGLKIGNRIKFRIEEKDEQEGEIQIFKEHRIPAKRAKKEGDQLAKVTVEGAKRPVYVFQKEIIAKLS